jgi:hypothetical protein
MSRKSRGSPRGIGLIGAAEGAPLSQGRDGSLPVELEGTDVTEPPPADEPVAGEPTEPEIHAPTTTHVEPRPVATGECTVEDLEGRPLCDAEE